MLRLGLSGIVGLLWLAGCSSTTHSNGGTGQGGAAGSSAGSATAAGAHAGTSSSGGADALGGTDSSGGSGVGSSADPTTPQGFCTGYYTIVAELFAKCWAISEAKTLEAFSDPALCQNFLTSVTEKRIGFDGTHGAACLKELKAALVCEGDVDEASVPDCTLIIQGLVPVGAACSPASDNALGHECMGDSYCQEATTYACAGVCAERAPVGAACDPLGTTVRCAVDASCDFTSKKCVAVPPPAQLNEACGAAPLGKCDDGLWCDIPTSAASGTCAAKKSSGPCETNSECARTKQCAGPEGAKSCADPKPVGASCTPGNRECNLLGHCAEDQKCSDAEAKLDEPCGILSGESVACTSDLYCDGGLLGPGVCRTPKAAGAACTGTSVGECAGKRGHCDDTDNTCVACE